VNAEELTAEELEKQRKSHYFSGNFIKKREMCNCNRPMPCLESKFLATIDALRTQLAEAEARLEADAAHFEVCRAVGLRVERETALRESLEEIERIVTTTGGPQLHMIMKIRDAIARALSGEGSNP
jgi:hypothetical protein